MSADDERAAHDLPAPEVLPVRTMLEEFDVNVLAPLVRCSKREFAPAPVLRADTQCRSAI